MLRTSAIFLSMCAMAGGCVEDPEPEDLEQAVADAFGEGDSVVRVEGTVVDWVTGEPIGGAEVEIDTAWGEPAFPVDREGAKVILTTDVEGRFGPVDVAVYNDGNNLLLFRVTGAGRAPTASDKTVSCGFTEPLVRCRDLDHPIAAPTAELVDGWRQRWLVEGQVLAETLGIVALQFRHRDLGEDVEGTPSSDVTPTYAPDLFGTSSLTPGDNLRFLEPDRATLSAPDQPDTTESGVALIMSTREIREVIGTWGTLGWTPIGVLFADGWVFVEHHIR